MCGCMLMHLLTGHAGHQSESHEEHQRTSPGTSKSPTKVSSAETRLCPHCGFQLRPEYAFCPGCGMRLPKMQCPACGQTIEAGWKHCGFCGYPLIEAQESPIQP
jgi:hypothetical protein